MSTSFPYLPPIISGARYIVVPFGWFSNYLSLKTLAIPKSISLILLIFYFSFSKMFSGFRSRWQMFCSCKYAMADSTCLMITAVWDSVICFFSTIV